jgi:hypothetical protein
MGVLGAVVVLVVYTACVLQASTSYRVGNPSSTGLRLQLFLSTCSGVGLSPMSFLRQSDLLRDYHGTPAVLSISAQS